MRVSLFCLFLFGRISFITGQTFVGEALLGPVEIDGFYRIMISPDVAIPLNTGFTNIRIHDGSGREVPYLLQVDHPGEQSAQFKNYQILERQVVENCCTTLILYNPEQNLLRNISLIIKNADVSKEAVLLGSDDRQHWFALKKRFVLTPTSNDTGTSEISIVDFPLSNYSYYSLQIADSTSAPLNILSAGYVDAQRSVGNYTAIPAVRVVKRDSVKQKMTYFRFQFDTLRFVDKLQFSLTGSSFFLRTAKLYERSERRVGNRLEKYDHLLQVIRVTSEHPAIIMLDDLKVSELTLVVENEDSPPLEIASSSAYQLDRFLTAYLKKGSDYRIKIGDEKFGAPVYDLSFFSEKIPANPPKLEIGEITYLAKSPSTSGYTFFTSKLFIWAAIILVIGLLGFMSFRVLKDTGLAEKK